MTKEVPEKTTSLVDVRRSDYADEDIVFYLQVYQDYALAEWCLGNLKRHYRGSRVILLSDGDDDPRFEELAGNHPKVEYVCGQRLFPMTHGGAMLHRMLEHFFRKPAAYLISIDTDAGFHRRFEYLPTRVGLFGTRQRLSLPDGGYQESIQGGFIGYTLSAAGRLFETRVFLAPELLDSRQTWGRSHWVQERIARTGLVSKDWIVGHCAKELRLPMYTFGEVKSTWNNYVPNDDRRYAVTHPCKDRRL